MNQDVIPPAARRWLSAIEPLGVRVEVVVVPEGSKTAEAAAAGIGCEVRHIVKSLVFEADGEPVVALVPGDRRVDTRLLADALGAARVSRADLAVVRAATGFAAGGTPPFGHARALRVVADLALDDSATLWIACGTPDTVGAVTHAELLAASSATVVALSS